jgi:hypothetical protein
MSILIPPMKIFLFFSFFFYLDLVSGSRLKKDKFAIIYTRDKFHNKLFFFSKKEKKKKLGWDPLPGAKKVMRIVSNQEAKGLGTS